MKISKRSIDPKQMYVIKTCDCCGSKITLFNEDIIKLNSGKSNEISFCCPECNNTLSVYKYFSGKAYTIDEYAECVSKFKTSRDEVLSELRNILVGYRTEYFSLHDIKFIADPLKITVIANVQDYIVTDSCIQEQSIRPYTTFIFDLSTKLAKCSLYEYAKCSQALLDYLKETLVYCGQMGKLPGYPPGTDISNIDDSELISCLRGGDTKIEITNISDLYSENKFEADKLNKSVYTPDIITGSEVIGNHIVEGANCIQDGLYAVAASMPSGVNIGPTYISNHWV